MDIRGKIIMSSESKISTARLNKEFERIYKKKVKFIFISYAEFERDVNPQGGRKTGLPIAGALHFVDGFSVMYYPGIRKTKAPKGIRLYAFVAGKELNNNFHFKIEGATEATIKRLRAAKLDASNDYGRNRARYGKALGLGIASMAAGRVARSTSGVTRAIARGVQAGTAIGSVGALFEEPRPRTISTSSRTEPHTTTISRTGSYISTEPGSTAFEEIRTKNDFTHTVKNEEFIGFMYNDNGSPVPNKKEATWVAFIPFKDVEFSDIFAAQLIKSEIGGNWATEKQARDYHHSISEENLKYQHVLPASYLVRWFKKIRVINQAKKKKTEEPKPKANKATAKKGKLKCWIMGTRMTLQEARKIDAMIDDVDLEMAECLADELNKAAKNLGNPRESPFIHDSVRGYKVVNICRVAFDMALAKCKKENASKKKKISSLRIAFFNNENDDVQVFTSKAEAIKFVNSGYIEDLIHGDEMNVIIMSLISPCNPEDVQLKIDTEEIGMTHEDVFFSFSTEELGSVLAKSAKEALDKFVKTRPEYEGQMVVTEQRKSPGQWTCYRNEYKQVSSEDTISPGIQYFKIKKTLGEVNATHTDPDDPRRWVWSIDYVAIAKLGKKIKALGKKKINKATSIATSERELREEQHELNNEIARLQRDLGLISSKIQTTLKIQQEAFAANDMEEYKKRETQYRRLNKETNDITSRLAQIGDRLFEINNQMIIAKAIGKKKNASHGSKKK
jgi:hypothetical protein